MLQIFPKIIKYRGSDNQTRLIDNPCFPLFQTRKDDSLEGYVVNVPKNDLHWFRTESDRGAADNATRNLVWEFIAAGVGAKWKKY